MDEQQIKSIVEAALFAAGEPLSLERLQSLFDEEARPDKGALRSALAALEQDYDGRSLEVKEVASGFRFQVRSGYATWVSRLWEERPARYSRAMLETLALIAYRQPITRGEIEEIRGVAVSTNIMKTLQEREWVRVVGHRDVPGKPAMYATTKEFLSYFNLIGLDQLPPLAEIRDIDKINAELDLRFPGADSDGPAVQSVAATDGEQAASGGADDEATAQEDVGAEPGNVQPADSQAVDEADAASGEQPDPQPEDPSEPDSEQQPEAGNPAIDEQQHQPDERDD